MRAPSTGEDFQFAVTLGSDTVEVARCAEYGIWYVSCDQAWCHVDLVSIDLPSANDAEALARDHLACHGSTLMAAFLDVVSGAA